jgi:hypothetical protein
MTNMLLRLAFVGAAAYTCGAPAPLPLEQCTNCSNTSTCKIEAQMRFAAYLLHWLLLCLASAQCINTRTCKIIEVHALPAGYLLQCLLLCL